MLYLYQNITIMTTIDIHKFQSVEKDLACRPNLILNFVIIYFPKEIPVSDIYNEIKYNIDPMKSIIYQLFEIRTKLLL